MAFAEGIEVVLPSVLIVLLSLLVVVALPRWQHSRDWGYSPAGILGAILCIVLVMTALGRL